MIISTHEIITSIKAVLDPLLSPVEVLTVIKPTTANRYIYLTALSESQINEKRAFLSQASISIQVIEKFDSRGGNYLWVNETARLIVDEITPDRLQAFGNVGNIDIFTMQFTDAPTELLETETGRAVIKSLRLEYKTQNL